MKYLLVLFLLVGLALAPTLSKAAATANESSIGTSCTNAANAVDFDTIAQCTSTSSTAGTMQKAPVFVGDVTVPPYTSTTCDSSKTGLIRYSSTNSFQGCDGSSWVSMSSSSTPTLQHQLFTSTGTSTFTVPTGASTSTVFKFTIVGGGGGGCFYNSYASAGGAGGTAIKWLSGLTASKTILVTVGVGGGGTSSSTGGAGGSSSIASGTQTITTVTGGYGSGGACSSSKTGGAGGTGTNGDLNIQGGYGGFSTMVSVLDSGGDTVYYYLDAYGGNSTLGGGGTATTTGRANTGGGGGALPGTYANTGGTGIVIVEWTL
jgi:hypothetical protein